MNDQPKLQCLLEIIIFLSSGLKYTREEIAQRFDLPDRSLYRYIKTLREVGFIIPKPKDGRYYIDKQSPYFKEIDELLHFSKEEAYILQKAIHSISNENLLKQNLIKKLYALYNSENVADTIIKMENSNNIHQLTQAIQQKRKVILCGYQSANSKVQRNRTVEPFKFTSNFISTWAYDIDSKSCKIFKNTRISSVKVLTDGWESENSHEALPMDVFRISSTEQTEVKLKLSVRACELLKEEYPIAEQYIQYCSENIYEFTAPVCGFDGVARFVLGLCHEIEVVYPLELKLFIKNRIKNILTDSSWQ